MTSGWNAIHGRDDDLRPDLAKIIERHPEGPATVAAIRLLRHRWQFRVSHPSGSGNARAAETRSRGAPKSDRISMPLALRDQQIAAEMAEPVGVVL